MVHAMPSHSYDWCSSRVAGRGRRSGVTVIGTSTLAEHLAVELRRSS